MGAGKENLMSYVRANFQQLFKCPTALMKLYLT